jgi:alkylhydroperoxidase family enzyme
MAWIDTIGPDEARGPLKDIYDAAIRRAGRVYQILRVQSQNAEALRASLQMYLTLMFGPSPLTRAQREMLAVVVSRANLCRY